MMMLVRCGGAPQRLSEMIQIKLMLPHELPGKSMLTADAAKYRIPSCAMIDNVCLFLVVNIVGKVDEFFHRKFFPQ